MISAAVASIHIYPLKAARAIDLGDALVEPCGLAGDRRWLLVDETGRFISQREEPAMARVVVQYTGPGAAISVFAAGHGEMSFAAPLPETGAELVAVTVWGSTVLAASAGPDAAKWFSAYLGRPARLVFLDDPTRRPVDPGYATPQDVVSFADGFPLLLTNTASLDQLGDWLADSGAARVPMNRFRPNVVVTGAPPWAEDRWRRVLIGEVPFRVPKPCGRCVVTTTDQRTGERGSQPLKMLGQRRRFGKELVFGQNMIPDGPGVIHTGDPVRVLEYRPGPQDDQQRLPMCPEQVMFSCYLPTISGGEHVESVVLVDEAGYASGTAAKSAVHHAHTPLHLAFSCYLFNETGQFLLTRRATSKLTWPGVWTNSCCGHPGPGESMTASVRRRLRTELGIGSAKLALVLPRFRYRAQMDNGVIENELCPVYAAYSDVAPDPDPAEVEEFSWVDWAEFRAAVQAGHQPVSPWCALQLAELSPLGSQPLTWEAADTADLPPAAVL